MLAFSIDSVIKTACMGFQYWCYVDSHLGVRMFVVSFGYWHTIHV